MKVDVPGRGAVDISRVAVVGPAWTDLDMYRETCELLQGTADAAEADGRVHEGWYAFHEARQACPLGNDRLRPGDCMHLIVSDGFADWNMPRDVRVQAIEPDGGEVELLGGGAAGCALAAENLLELLRGLPDSLARTLAVRAAEECALWIGEIEEGNE